MNRTSLLITLIVPSLFGACGAGENTVGTDWTKADASAGDTQTSKTSDPCSDCSEGSSKLLISAADTCLSAHQRSGNSFVIENRGNAASGALKVSLGGAGASSFVIISDACSGNPLPAFASCGVAIMYAPTSAHATAEVATLTVADAKDSASVDIRGSDVGTVTLSPATVSFGEVAAGSTSGEVLIRVTTTSFCDTTWTATVNDAIFVISSNTCIGRASTCEIGVRLAPAAAVPASPISGVLTVTASDSGTATVALSGVITETTPQTEPLNFGEVVLGQSYTADLSFTVGNDPPTASLTGSGAAQFSIVSMTAKNTCTTPGTTCTNTCTIPGATCTIQIKFTPAAAGPSNATLSITHGKGTETLTFSLSGTGIDASVAAPFTAIPMAIAFGQIPVGTTTSPLTITVTTPSARTFTATLSDSVASEMAIVEDTCTGSSISANGTCAISVVYTPTKIGKVEGTLNISDGTDLVSVHLAGEGWTLL